MLRGSRKLFLFVMGVGLLWAGRSNASAAFPQGMVKLTTGIFNSDSRAEGLVVQTNGSNADKIVLCGYTTVAGQKRWTVARFTANGRLDPTFNAASTPGYWQASTGPSMARSIIVQAATSAAAAVDSLVAVGKYPGTNCPASGISYTADGVFQATNGNGQTNSDGIGIALLNSGGANPFSTFTFMGSCLGGSASPNPPGSGNVFPYFSRLSTFATLGKNANRAVLPGFLPPYSDNARGGLVGTTLTSATPTAYLAAITMVSTTTTMSFIMREPQAADWLPYTAISSPVNGQFGTMAKNTAMTNAQGGTGVAATAICTESYQCTVTWTLDPGSNSANLLTTGTTFIVANTLTEYPYGFGGAVAWTDPASASSTLYNCACNGLRQPYISRALSTGVLDTSFNGDGINLETSTALSPAFYTGTAFQSTGKVIVAGFTENAGFGAGRWILTRYNTDGTRDTLFGIDTTGLFQDTAAPFNVSGASGFIHTTTIDPSGKLIVAGEYNGQSFIARYETTGSSPRDTTFNTDGVAINDLTASATINKVINSDDGGYFVAAVSNNDQFTTALYAGTGGLSMTYNSNGIVQETGVGVSAAYDMLLNGTALAVAGVTNTNQLSVINYGTDGARDSSIGTNGLQQFPELGTGIIYGITTTTSTSRYGAGQVNTAAFVGILANKTGVLLDIADPFNTGANGLLYTTTINQLGAVIAGGQYDGVWKVVSYVPTGTRNPDFGTDGVAIDDGVAVSRARSIALDSTGRILVVGTSGLYEGTVVDLAWTVSRYSSAGVFEQAVQEVALGIGTALGLLIDQDDDSFVVVGYTQIDGQNTPTVVYYHSDMTHNATIGDDGVETFTSLAPGMFNAIQIADDRTFVAGSSDDTALILPLPDGTGLLQDTQPPFSTGLNARIFGTLDDKDGNLVVCGNYNNTLAVVRYTADGIRDTTFGPNHNGAILNSALGVANGYSVTQDRSGNYYLSAASRVDGTLVFTVIKYTNSGDLDTSFGSGGVIQETMFGVGTAFQSVVDTTQGVLTVCGELTVNGLLLPAAIRYTLVEGARVLTFGTGGVQTFSLLGAGNLRSISNFGAAGLAAAGATDDQATIVAFQGSARLIAQIESGF